MDIAGLKPLFGQRAAAADKKSFNGRFRQIDGSTTTAAPGPVDAAVGTYHYDATCRREAHVARREPFFKDVFRRRPPGCTVQNSGPHRFKFSRAQPKKGES